MKSTFASVFVRVLIVLMAWTPYQMAHAGMIGTDQVVQTSQSDRGEVLSFLSRSDVAGQLQAYGLDSTNAKDRVAAMTDDEVRYLAGRIGSQPAGASDAGTILLILVIVAVIWWAWKR
jgi:hypothetical protein